MDDFCWLLRKSLAGPLTSAILLFLVAFGCPLSWKKTAIGLSNTCGWHLPNMRWSWCWIKWLTTRPSRNKNWTVPWDACSGPPTAVHSPSHSFKPFGNGNQRLSPQANPTSFSVALHIYSIASLRKTTIIQPLTLLRAPGGGQAMQVPQTEAYVGGWISNHPNPAKHQVWWFHYQVKEDQHPYPFKDRKPKRRIAALEMLGTLFLTMYLCKKSSSLRGPVLLPLASDNQGNIYGLLND